jgi:hypothetical protein
MSNELLKLFCHILGDSSDRIFPVKIASTESVGELKKEIKAQKSLTFQDIEADTLDLYQVSISIKDFDAKVGSARSPEEVEGSAKLNPWDELRESFSSPLKKHIHVILQRPKGECTLLPHANCADDLAHFNFTLLPLRPASLLPASPLTNHSFDSRLLIPLSFRVGCAPTNTDIGFPSSLSGTKRPYFTDLDASGPLAHIPSKRRRAASLNAPSSTTTVFTTSVSGTIKPSKFLKFTHVGDTRIKYHLRGPLYFGNFHFTSCIISTEGDVS